MLLADDAVTTRLDALLAPWNCADAPGLALGVAMEGRTVYRRGFGMASLESGTPIGPATRMRIASITKQFTAMLVLILAEEGLLDLDRPIGAYLPELTGAAAEPSLRDLLDHRGGARCYLDIAAHAHGLSLAPHGYVTALQTGFSALNFMPGQSMLYSNGGYQLVSLAIERVGGAPFDVQMRTRLLEPLGMHDTLGLASDHEILPGMATLHVASGHGRWLRGLFQFHENRGDGALVSTIDDMLIWMARMRRHDGPFPAHLWGRLIEARPFADGRAGRYALGLSVGMYRGRPTISHGGAARGGSAELLTFPQDGLDIVLLSNGAPDAKPSLLARQTADLLLGDRLEPSPSPVRAAQHVAHLGDWWSPRTGMVYSLLDQQGTLALAFCGSRIGYALESAQNGFVVALEGMDTLSIGAAPIDGCTLVIRYGADADQFHKLGPVTAEGEQRRLAGRYWCADARCTAQIGDGDSLDRGRFYDDAGDIDVTLRWFANGVALTEPRGSHEFHQAALSCDAEGFWLSSMRTRRLRFERLQ